MIKFNIKSIVTPIYWSVIIEVDNLHFNWLAFSLSGVHANIYICMCNVVLISGSLLMVNYYVDSKCLMPVLVYSDCDDIQEYYC